MKDSDLNANMQPRNPLANCIREIINMNISTYQIERPLSCVMTIAMLAAMSLLAVGTAQAADWRFDPEIRVGYELDDNAPLVISPDSTDEIQGYIIEGSATIGSATQRTSLDITPTIRTRNYDEERFDSDDGFLSLNYNHEF